MCDVYNAPTTHKDHHQQALVDAQHLSVHDLLSISARLKTVFNCMFHNKNPKSFLFNFWGSLQCLRHFLFGAYVSSDAVHRLAHITPPVFLAVIANHVFLLWLRKENIIIIIA